MSKSRKPVNKKKVLKIVLISLAVFIILNLIGAAVGTSTSITHPRRDSYSDVEQEKYDLTKNMKFTFQTAMNSTV